MDKLIVTVTVDSSVSYPENPYCPKMGDIKSTAAEYNRSVDAGASVCHVHGVHHLEDEIQPDGKRLSSIDFDGWQELQDRIKEKNNAVMQYGIASARMPDKKKLMLQKPELMSYCFTSHDEVFQPNPALPPKCTYALHPTEELREFLRACNENGVRPDVETFQVGAVWNMNTLHAEGLLKEPAWATLFVSWPGGAWTPPNPKALIALVEQLPPYVNWTVSCMDYDVNKNWEMLTQAIIMGGHVRVGWEDNPYIEPGVYAKSCAELVEKIVKISRLVGREIASPDEARAVVQGKTK